jgi:crossover junction endonuclease MUS81
MTELVIDIREKELISELEGLGTCHIVEQLPIGDILYRDPDSKETMYVMERKTVNDLKASICDGRAREQKARLMGTTPRERICYLVEGNMDVPTLDEDVGGVPMSTLVGSMINTQLRDGIHVYKTLSIRETANYVTRLLDKIIKDGNMYWSGETNKKEYASTLNKVKKANMTPLVWYSHILLSIPGVTENIVGSIQEVYGTMNSLVSAYGQTPEHLRVKLLSDFKYTIKEGKERRVGDKVSGRICEFFTK